MTAAIEVGDAVERDPAAELGADAPAGLRAGLERLAHDPPWDAGPAARRRGVW